MGIINKYQLSIFVFTTQLFNSLKRGQKILITKVDWAAATVEFDVSISVDGQT